MNVTGSEQKEQTKEIKEEKEKKGKCFPLVLLHTFTHSNDHTPQNLFTH
jgi:hypothetical protein